MLGLFSEELLQNLCEHWLGPVILHSCLSGPVLSQSQSSSTAISPIGQLENVVDVMLQGPQNILYRA